MRLVLPLTIACILFAAAAIIKCPHLHQNSSESKGHAASNSPARARRRSILADEPSFKRSCWHDVSDEAKDFVTQLLNKDPTKRPSAHEALQHPWLQGTVADRTVGPPLASTVVARIQRFAQRYALSFTLLAGSLSASACSFADIVKYPDAARTERSLEVHVGSASATGRLCILVVC